MRLYRGAMQVMIMFSAFVAILNAPYLNETSFYYNNIKYIKMAFFNNPYLEIALVDHLFKNVFMLPGIALAWYLDQSTWSPGLLPKLKWAIFS